MIEPVGTGRRGMIRLFAAAMAAVTTLMYLLIGLRIVSVLDDPNADLVWAIFAACAYALGAALLVTFDRRALWIVGAALQVFVIITYFNLASQRAPAFEIWGILIRIAQALLLVALVVLAMRARTADSAART